MLVIDVMPSGRVNMNALSRPLHVGAPPVTPPAWTLPSSSSSSAIGLPKLKFWAFHVRSVKPRWYDQSCMRLCIANRFAVAASMSLPTPGTKFARSQRVSNQTFVHG
jgi:hypothetical protein